MEGENVLTLISCEYILPPAPLSNVYSTIVYKIGQCYVSQNAVNDYNYYLIFEITALQMS